jgi:hypothetical protein
MHKQSLKALIVDVNANHIHLSAFSEYTEQVHRDLFILIYKKLLITYFFLKVHTLQVTEPDSKKKKKRIKMALVVSLDFCIMQVIMFSMSPFFFAVLGLNSGPTP